MSASKDIETKTTFISIYFATGALLAALLVRQASWIWESLYFQNHSEIEIVLALGLIACVISTSVVFLGYTFGRYATLKLVNIGIALILTLAVFQYLRQLRLIPITTSDLHKVFALLVAVAVGFLALKISFDKWRRLYIAILIGGLIFVFFPWVLATMKSTTIYWPSPSFQSPTVVAPKVPMQNTIVLLLDELSASAANPLVLQLKNNGYQVKFSAIDPAGKNTINVIPAIWMRSNFDQSAPCGSTRLCSSTNVIDFSRVRASSENIDIVGFYHRYCSIEGLRSCYYGPLPEKSVFIALACSFPWIDKLSILQCSGSESVRDAYLNLRENQKHALMKAPFWQKGGILYAHLLVPHPLLGIPLKSLTEEYNENISDAAALVNIIAQNAKIAFGDNINIVIFSDHPLRPEFWCSNKYFVAAQCKPDASQISNQVPLIFASPHLNNEVKSNIKNNMMVFDVLFENH